MERINESSRKIKKEDNLIVIVFTFEFGRKIGNDLVVGEE